MAASLSIIRGQRILKKQKFMQKLHCNHTVGTEEWILEAKTDCYGKDQLFAPSFAFWTNYDLDLKIQPPFCLDYRALNRPGLLWWSYLGRILGGAPWGPKCSWNKRPLICLQSVTKRIKKGFVTKRDMQRLKNEVCPCSLNRGPKSTQWSALQLLVRK